MGKWTPAFNGFAGGVCLMAMLAAITEGRAGAAAMCALFFSLNIGLAVWRTVQQ